MKEEWKGWWQEVLNSSPLSICPILAFTINWKMGIITFILTLYIGHLYDLKWQVKLKELQKVTS